MRVIRSIDSLRSYRRAANGRIGFIPTMGALHAGHISLIEQARKECDTVICSIFVNPKQFGPTEDFDKYPRVFEQDCSLMAEAKVDLVFAPTPTEMYPKQGITNFQIDVPETKESQARPGFFNGVALVVCKLFNIVQPDNAYFGQKDAIQCIVIRNMVEDLNFPIDLKIVPTMREKDGLAMSSRNRYLTPEERKVAAVFPHALFKASELALTEKKRDPVLQMALTALHHPNIVIDYVSLASLHNGKEIDVIGPEGALLSAAIKIGKTRLIDNVIIE